ncbi:fucoxanthin-chlorophyll a-c binding protein C [Striga asiatica]|uniref:Fucoxanthin-chlorophyll a-c binding protein C n=1 Tax=Striga asiatica TaxID=4170 RepID=A0A5A7R7C4_STRAF|nr:fucoxanthin-chlorophyll a-c binding protein C [Striga asiatica]
MHQLPTGRVFVSKGIVEGLLGFITIGFSGFEEIGFMTSVDGLTVGTVVIGSNMYNYKHHDVEQVLRDKSPEQNTRAARIGKIQVEVESLHRIKIARWTND